MRRVILGATLGLLAGIASASASQRDWDDCVHDDADRSIRGCTRVIQSSEPRRVRAKAHFNRAIVWNQKGDRDKAIADYSDAIRLDPDYADAYNNRANQYARRDDSRRSLADFTQVVRLRPNDAGAHNARGESLENLNEFAAALEAYDTAIRLRPTFARAFLNRGDIRRKTGDVDGAIADYGEAIRLDAKHEDALEFRSHLLFQQGKFREAAADRARLVAMSDHLRPALLHHIALARAGERDTSHLESETRRADSAELLLAVTDLFLGRGTPQAALALADPDRRCQVQFLIGQWHLLRGDTSEARGAFQSVTDSCSPRSFDHGTARVELARLNAQ